MNQSVKDLPAHSVPFPFQPLSSSTITDIRNLLDKHNSGTFHVVGSLTWLGPESLTPKKSQNGEKRVRDARITDSTASIEISLWNQHIDQINEGEFYSITNCRMKYFYGKKLSTTEETVITTAEKQKLAPTEELQKPQNILCCPDILNVCVNIYPVCNSKDCRKKVSANPGSKVIQCQACGRSMLIKNCYVEVNASFQLEKDNRHRNVTAFAKVLSSFLGEDLYQQSEEVLTEKLLLLENVDFNLSQTGKLITSMTKHVASKGQQDNDTQSNNSEDDADFQAAVDSVTDLGF